MLERRYRADAGKVRKLLLDLAALQIVEEKTHDPARYAVLGVEDVASATATGTRVDVKRGSGAIQSLIVGKGNGSRESYVRVATAKASFLARPQVALEASPSRWLDTTLLDVDAARIRRVVLEPAGQSARTLEGARLPPALAGALKGLALEDLRARALEKSGPGSKTPAPQRAQFVTSEGLTIGVEGREDGGRRWIALTAMAGPAAANATTATTTARTTTVTSPAPAPAAPAPADPAAEARLLAQRFEGREFEIPAYRYATLFEASPAAP